jgi:hypothetical protein
MTTGERQLVGFPVSQPQDNQKKELMLKEKVQKRTE